MKALRFKSNDSTKAALFIDSMNNRLKNSGKDIAQYKININPQGRTSVTLYFN